MVPVQRVRINLMSMLYVGVLIEGGVVCAQNYACINVSINDN